MGCAFPLKDIEKYELRGRDERNGLPAKVEMTSDEIGEAMLESVVKVVHKIQSVLEETPPELTADIGNAGIVLTGGGAKLRGLDTAFISKKEGVRTNRRDCVILGAGRAVQWIDSVKMDAGRSTRAADRVLLRSGVWKRCPKAARYGPSAGSASGACSKGPWRLSG